MNFKISYEDAKRLLSVFYQSPYQLSAPFVCLLDNLKNEEDQTLRQCIDKDTADAKAVELPKTE